MLATLLVTLLILVSQVSTTNIHIDIDQHVHVGDGCEGGSCGEHHKHREECEAEPCPEPEIHFSPGEQCKRRCVKGETMTCYWKFVMQDYHTLSRACFNCPEVIEDCSRPQCIATDGTSRAFLAINREHPGTPIEVCEGDRVIVDVYNGQLSDIETIHWHGQLMKGYQFYDGVPFVTQCPILGHGPFRYDFAADSVGTDFWHSHSGTHRGDGIYGAFIVRTAEDPHIDKYDVDDNFFVLQDWFHTTVYSYFLGMMLAGTGWANFDAMLINGKGRNTKAAIENVTAYKMPLEVVNVKQGQRLRLRIIDSGVSSSPKIVSVDNHTMLVIATDAKNIKPTSVDSFVLSPGERFDVVIVANQSIDTYWIRVNAQLTGSKFKCIQGAILRYEGAGLVDPSAELIYSDTPPGLVLNPFGVVEGANVLTMLDLDNLEDYSLKDYAIDKKFYLVFSFNNVNNTAFFDKDFYPANNMTKKWELHTPQLNDVTFEFPSSPPMSQPCEPQPTICHHGHDMSDHCDGDFCSCTQVFHADLGDMVEMVLINTAFANHPFHLHGYSYSVVGMGKLGLFSSLEQVKALDEAGNITRKLDNPVLKDTVTIPSGGYTVIRFRADNPGYWLMHCHLLIHSEAGMIGILHVGKPCDLPPVPCGFPECKSFKPGKGH